MLFLCLSGSPLRTLASSQTLKSSMLGELIILNCLWMDGWMDHSKITHLKEHLKKVPLSSNWLLPHSQRVTKAGHAKHDGQLGLRHPDSG